MLEWLHFVLVVLCVIIVIIINIIFDMLDVVWCSGYENLEDRKEVREAAWSRPGWDRCVSRTGAHTFPLSLSIPEYDV